VPNPPKTWDELFAIAEKLKNEGYTAFLYPAGRNETTSCDVLPWFWSQGGLLVDDAGRPVFDQGNNRTYMLNTLNFIKRTIDTGITPVRVSTFGTDNDMIPEVVAGKVAMFAGGSWLASELQDILGKEEFQNAWGLAQIPMPAGGKRVSTAGGWTTGVFTRDDQKRRLAADFAIHCFIEDAAMDEYTALSGQLPTRTTIYENSEHFSKDPVLVAYGRELEYARVRPGVEIYNNISQEFQVAISDVITGEAAPERALETMSQNIQGLVK
jgi:multiple sugar transport system substrate-binding protein